MEKYMTVQNILIWFSIWAGYIFYLFDKRFTEIRDELRKISSVLAADVSVRLRDAAELNRPWYDPD